MNASGLPGPIDRGSHPYLFDRYILLDVRVTSALARVVRCRPSVALGIVFLWFGVLKFFPNLSPAETLAVRTIEQLTFGAVRPDPDSGTRGLGVGHRPRADPLARPAAGYAALVPQQPLLLLAVRLAGTFTPLLLFPSGRPSRRSRSFRRSRASTSSRTSCSSGPRWSWAPRSGVGDCVPRRTGRPGASRGDAGRG